MEEKLNNIFDYIKDFIKKKQFSTHSDADCRRIEV